MKLDPGKRPLAVYARELVLKGTGAATLEHPVLLWESGERVPDVDSESLVTASDGGALSPRPGNPLVIVLKPEQTQTKIGGISVGRSESNDVVVENPSVSRFHALIHRDPRTQEWKITDAGSRNGTFVNGARLQSEQSTLLSDGATLKLGDAQLRFFLPPSFLAYVEARVDGVPE